MGISSIWAFGSIWEDPSQILYANWQDKVKLYVGNSLDTKRQPVNQLGIMAGIAKDHVQKLQQQQPKE